MTIDIPADVARRLQALAKRDEADIGDLLRDLLDRHESERENDQPWATLADLARHAKKMNMASSESVNTAERSREILNTEFADYLKRRMDP